MKAHATAGYTPAMQDDLFASAGEAGTDDPHRLFFALWPDAGLREDIARVAASPGSATGRPVGGGCAPIVTT